MTPLPSRAVPVTTATLDRVARTEFDSLWFLIPFAAVVGLFAAAIPAKDRDVAWVFAGLGAFAVVIFIWAWLERRAAHRRLECIHVASRLRKRRDEAAAAAEAVNPGPVPEIVLRQYTVLVGFFVLGATFQTHFYARHRPWLATATTLLLGWWSFPWGPVRTVRTIASNLRGGTARSEAHLLAELGLTMPAPPAWWRRLLSLDSKNPAQVVSRLATLAMVVVVVVMVVTVFVKAMLVAAPSR